uniref:Maf-like protein n=1 Tax=Mucochytrium quahogii TaxID=96639 RepID=A0A7S2SGP4_9STRA|mmetsp:Transcript_10899/g.17855  ORF Transcript_10899/g.17855 Transcript_10899/m.17855 type:complete len:204 (-) Transcript_10899:166-777(-)
MSVVLGSSSRWRASLVEKALPTGFTLHPKQLSPDIDEKAIRRPDPNDLVTAIANAKTDALLKVIEEKGASDADYLICADQVIVFDSVVREKPIDKAQAKEHLQSYGEQNKPAVCTSGIVVTNLRTGKRYSGVDIAIQHFLKVPDQVADALIEKGDIMYCAGSFVAEDPLLEPYLGPREGEMESVQGMPVALTVSLLQQAAAEN